MLNLSEQFCQSGAGWLFEDRTTITGSNAILIKKKLSRKEELSDLIDFNLELLEPSTHKLRNSEL